MLSTRMEELQRKFGTSESGPKLVSFTVDPDTDTPERLKEYAARYEANPVRWMFLTGDSQTVQKTVTDGFKLSAVKSKDDPATIFHANKFVLVDGRGRIRGYYDIDEPGLAALRDGIARLQKEK